MTLIDADDGRRLSNILYSDEVRFDKLAKIGDLDPSHDFRFADLRDVDFGESQLDGWDFTGADLRGASFRGAHVRNCIFDRAVGLDLTGAIESVDGTDRTDQINEAARFAVFEKLADQLGAFVGQATETGIKAVKLFYEGEVSKLNTHALTAVALAGLLKPLLRDVNAESAPDIAKERGVAVEQTVYGTTKSPYDSVVSLTIVAERQERTIRGTVFAGRPRIISIKGIEVDIEFSPSMLYVTGTDKPALLGRLITMLADAGINVANLNIGREQPGGNIIALLHVDGPVPKDVVDALRRIPDIQRVMPLAF
jgi:hypothetical protein